MIAVSTWNELVHPPTTRTLSSTSSYLLQKNKSPTEPISVSLLSLQLALNSQLFFQNVTNSNIIDALNIVVVDESVNKGEYAVFPLLFAIAIFVAVRLINCNPD